MNKDNNNNSDYFDKDAYDFIRFISSPPSLSKEQKPHKKRYAVVFLIVFSIVFIAAAKHTYHLPMNQAQGKRPATTFYIRALQEIHKNMGDA